MSEENSLNYRGRKATRARSEQRRKAILEAALRIVVSDGVRGVRHRAVAKEADVPLSATTYYFKDISDLIADTFTLFAESAMNDVVAPIHKQVGDFLEEHKADVGRNADLDDQVLNALSLLIVTFLKHEVTDKRDHVLAEQAFRHECVRDTRLRSVAQAYFDHLLGEMVKLCELIGVDDPDIAAELLTGTLSRIEQEALMVPKEQFDEAKASRLLKRQLLALMPKKAV